LRGGQIHQTIRQCFQEIGKEASMKTVVIVLFLTLAASTVIAGGNPKPQGLLITQNIADIDASGAPYSIQSDGLGVYKDGLAGGVSGDVSVLMSNANPIYADRLLDLRTAQIRQVSVRFLQGPNGNEVLPGDPGYVVPANPPVWGTIRNSVKFMN